MTLKMYTSPVPREALRIISLPYVNSTWIYSPAMATLGFDLGDLDIWPLILAFCMDIISVNGNNSWKFPDDMAMET